ncbi:MAG: hypothetical protein EPO30_03015 [Lysobacteraceae bacterium]|nr:MAG: hypothetical protein EPO30_03015 [Xanthomonadaceae bacterium]
MAWRPAPAIVVVALLLGALAACDTPPPFVQLSGLVLDARLQEISGIAASRRHPDTVWMVNDGGSAPELHAVSRRGSRIASLRLEGVDNTDWEDLAAFELDGRSYLLVADTGDNGGLRKTLQLHVVAEPMQLADATIAPAWSIVFRWPDGPRDCEAVAVDAIHGEVLLVSKKRQPPELFSLPLRPQGHEPLVAKPLGTLHGVPQGDADEVRANPELARIRSQVTAADIAPDRHAMAVLTYRDVLVYPRRGRENWAKALARKPEVHPLPWLPQAEALAWSADGQALYATGEISPSPLLYLNPRRD